MKRLLAALTLIFATVVFASVNPYDESADAKADIRRALADASAAKVPVMVVFGANWCGDCKVLDLSLKEGASASQVAREFKIVKVNVGRFDRNVDVADSYGVPLKKGIPAVAILSAKNEVLYVTRAGELADARKNGRQGHLRFLQRHQSGGEAAEVVCRRRNLLPFAALLQTRQISGDIDNISIR
jgi:thioredoxin 1